MRSTFTDGSYRDIPENCLYCNLDTGGRHKVKCPLFENQVTPEGWNKASKQKPDFPFNEEIFNGRDFVRKKIMMRLYYAISNKSRAKD